MLDRQRASTAIEDTKIIREGKKDPTILARFFQQSLQFNVSERILQRRI